MRRLGIVAAGLALVVGIVVGGVVGNVFGASAQRASSVAVTGSGCYTNWNSAACAAGYTAVSTGEWTAVAIRGSVGIGDPTPITAGLICAADKPPTAGVSELEVVSDTNGYDSPATGHGAQHEPCAICCGTGPSVVGGFAELPAVAGPPGGSGMGGATYAVLAGAAAGVLAFAVLATLSVKRWGVR